jgi:hypothetical protein
MSFYKTHSVFFMVAGGLLFGFLRGQDHMALAALFVSSPYLVSIPILFWSAYVLMVVRANRSCVENAENEFLHVLLWLPTYNKTTTLFVMALYQLFPVTAYGIFLLVVALHHQMAITFGIVLFALLAMVVAVAGGLSRALHHISEEKKQWAIIGWMNRHLTRPYTLFFIEWIFRKQWVVMFLVKGFSFLLLLGILLLYQTDAYDVRLLGMALALVAGIHTNGMYELHRFNNLHFSLLRNLPLPLGKRQSSLLVVWLLLFVPEMALCVRYAPEPLSAIDWLGSLLYLLSIPIFYDGWLTTHKGDRHTVVFFYILSLMVLILFGVPPLVLALLNMAGGTYLTHRYYYFFEAADE